MLGSLGDIPFEVSENNVRTFSDLAFQYKASYAEHKILARKSLLEYTGHSALTCSLKISLSASLGINPLYEINRLKNIFDNHEAVTFILGNVVQGSGQWVIENMNITYNTIGSKGEIYSAEINLSLKEAL